MLSIVSKKGNKYGVKDSTDGVVEFCTIKELTYITETLGLKIRGFRDGKVTAKKAQSETSGVSKPTKRSSIVEVGDYCFSLMRSKSNYWQEQHDFLENNGHLALRNWGEWQIPEDAYQEVEDECELEDYDFEELTDKWTKVLTSVKKELKKKFPDIDFCITTSEKNWIDITFSRKG